MKKKWWNSLRIKIIAWSFVPTVIILSAVAWFTFYSYQKVIGDLAIKQDWAIVQSKTGAIQQAFLFMLNPFLSPVILNIDINYDLPIDIRAQNILDQAQGLDLFDGGIYYLDHLGKVYKTWPVQPELHGQDWSDTLHFQYIRENPGISVVTDLQSIATSGKEVVCVAMPMNGSQREFLGAGLYCFTIYPPIQNAYYETFNSLDLDPGKYLLLDGNQHIIYSPDSSDMGIDLSGESHLKELLQGQSLGGRFQIGNEDMLVSYAILWPIDPEVERWIVVKEQSWAEIMQPSLPYRQLLLVLLALGVIVPVLVTAYGVRHITTPIQKLIRAAEQVTAGQLQQRIDVNTGDEIETLANQFNVMSAKLDDSYSSLEKRVADRTRELAILNSIISVASHSLDLQEILADALNKTVEQMAFDAGAAFRLDADPMTSLLIAQRGFDQSFNIDLVSSFANTSQETTAEHPPKVTAYQIEELQDEEHLVQWTQSGFHLLVSVPLSTKGSTLGLFILGKREPGQLSPEELSLLSSIGKQVGVAMENARLYEQAEQTAITAERSRLARELHDAVTQTLFSANLIADVLPRIWKRDPEEGLQNLEELRQLTRGALAEMRTLLLEMRPESLQRSDIQSLLTQLADAFVGRVRVPISLDIQGNCELTHEVKIVFYRVAQEALNNIAKHSGARQVELHLECQSGRMNLMIKDDGLGFDADTITSDHMGIAIMRERANSIGANLKLESQLGQGTTIELDWRSARED
jgi:two-component system nitrate/nitrite sensor histidine kinase NarX